MLDPWTALSAAASIAQFIEFGAKLVSKSNEIRKGGSSVDIKHLKKITSDLVGLNVGLRSRKKLEAGQSVKDLEQGLDDLVLGCSAVANELIECLGKLTLAETDEKKKWKSFRAALKTIWSKEKVDELAKRLDGYRQELGTRFLVLLNAKSDVLFSRLDEKSQAIVEAVTFSRKTLMTTLKEDLTELEERVLLSQREESDQQSYEHELKADERMEKTIAAILTLRDGTTRTLASQSPVLSLDGSIQNQDRFIETATTFRNEGPSVDQYTPIARRILDLLYFRTITLRGDAISEAHETTYEWIFTNPDEQTQTRPWNSFRTWLQSGNGIYWISGKPGSGKSTLVKFITNHEQTRIMLQKWRGSEQLVVASFFFWRAGTSIQRSYTGLLRGLLFEILEQHQYFIPMVFPGLCRILLADWSAQPEALGLTELQMAFERLVRELETHLKVCIFIDGLDEYEGDHYDICQFLLRVTSRSHIKVLVSSRPWNIFQDSFENLPSLRLQDLTYHDIQAYVADNLYANKHMNLLKLADKSFAEGLVEEIASKADGVFLWVMLVVRSLLHGLINRDNVAILQERLRKMPSDLTGFYNFMLSSMEPRYRQQGSRLLRLVARSVEIQSDGPLSVLQLAYAEDSGDNIDSTIGSPMKLVLADERALIRETMEARLNSTCFGLVEVYEEKRIGMSGSSSIEAQVGFLHRTVLDFLYDRDTQETLRSFTSQEVFNPDLSLLGSCLYEAKALPVERTVLFDTDRVMIDMRHCLLYARTVEMKMGRPYTKVLDDLNKTMIEHWKGAVRLKKKPTDEEWLFKQDNDHWATFAAKTMYAKFLWNAPVDEFLLFSTYSSCVLYVADKTLGDAATTSTQRTLLATQMLRQLFIGETTDRFNYITAIANLLKQGADPNLIMDFSELSPSWKGDKQKGETVFDKAPDKLTAWEYLVYHISCTGPKARGHAQGVDMAIDLIQVLENVLEAGADVDVLVPHSIATPMADEDINLQPSRTRTALKVVQDYATAVAEDRTAFVGSVEELAQFQSIYERVVKKMEEKGAKSRAWEHGQLVFGPVEEPGSLQGMHLWTELSDWGKSNLLALSLLFGIIPAVMVYWICFV